MSSQLNRRDFLKLVSLLPLLQVKRPYFIGKPNRTVSDPSAPNVFILVFDTLSAFHISLHGYQRETTPNLARFAERATVYHNHYSGGNFTSPGTASILTGTYPWSNRAIHLYGTVSDNLEDKNIFNLFAPKGYYRIGYTHNLLVRTLLAQFLESLDALTETRELCLVDLQLSDRVFPKDYGVALSGEMRSLRGGGAENLPPGSVFMSWLYNLTRHSSNLKLAKELGELFPRGVPSHQNLSFTIEDAVDWMQLQASTLPQPYLAYVHLLPPHQPYRTRRDFVDKFDDGWEPSPKPAHFFSPGRSQQETLSNRRWYDEFIAYVDAEFGRFYDFMEETGALDNTYLVFTSDHGELFERGIIGHWTQTLFEPVIKVPLLISKPGQRTREDVHTPTSCVDLLPTLLHATSGRDSSAQPVPDWCEGEILPTFGGGEPGAGRSIFAVEAKSNPKFGPLAKGTIAMVKGQHKLIHYLGYPGFEREFELYDLESDPEERTNLYSSAQSLAAELQEELEEKLREVNRPFRSP